MSNWRFMMGVVLSSVALGGCGGHALDVGSNDAGASGAQGSGAALLPLGPIPDASGVTKEVWTGHLVNQQFLDGSNTLTLTLDFPPGGQVTGTLLLGDGALLQSPTDPNVGYPPGSHGMPTLVEGFPYTVLNASESFSPWRFQISEDEVWVQWCALQTPYLFKGNDAAVPPYPDYYECAPPLDGTVGTVVDSTGCYLENHADGGRSLIECEKLELCQASVCQCSAAGCRGNDSPMRPGAWVVLSLAGTMATGTMSGDFGDYSVQFIRSR